MYYYEKDYIMRLIHGTAMVLARLLLGKQMEDEAEIAGVLTAHEKEQNDLLLRMIDEGEINRAEEYPASVSSLEPEPRDFPQATCMPAESSVPTAPMESSSGLDRLYAAIASSPRNRPIMMLSTSKHRETASAEKTCADSICRISFRIIG